MPACGGPIGGISMISPSISSTRSPGGRMPRSPISRYWSMVSFRREGTGSALMSTEIFDAAEGSDKTTPGLGRWEGLQ